MTMFTKPEPSAAREARGRARSARRRRRARPARSSPLKSTNPSGASPSATPASWTSDGSSTTTTSGSVTESWRRIGSVRDARERAQRRAAPLGPVLRERLHALARRAAAPARGSGQRSSRPGRRARASGSRSCPFIAATRRAPRRRASPRATAWTTLAPPLTASPAAKIFGFEVRPSSSTASSRARNSSRGRWPIALTTVSTGMTNSLPGTGSGRRRPLSSGAPSRISAQRTPSTRSSPTNATGLVRKRISTPSSPRELDLVLVGRHLLLGAPVRAGARRRRRAASPRPRRRPRCCRRR